MYTRFKRKAEANHNCPLCDRKFLEDNDVKAFIRKLEDTVLKLPKKQEELSDIISRYEERRKTLKSLEPTWLRLKTIRENEIVDLQKSVEKYNTEKNALMSNIDRVRFVLRLYPDVYVLLTAPL